MINLHTFPSSCPNLETALRSGDLEQFRRVVTTLQQNGTDIPFTQPFHDGFIPLSVACRDGFLPLVRELVEVHSVDVNQIDENNQTPLYYSASKNRISVAQYLVAHGANVDPPVNAVRSPLWTASFYGYSEMAAFLIEKGADVNFKDQYDQTALHIAAQRPNTLETIKILLQNGAYANTTDRWDDCAMRKALRLGPIENISFLLHQKMSPISQERLDECTLFASTIGLTNVVSEALRIRNGSKFTSEVDKMSEKVIETRAIAWKMMSYFQENLTLYQDMKTMIMDNLRKRDPFSDDILLAIVMFAQKQNEEEARDIWSVIMLVVSQCLSIRPRDSPHFVWFEQFLVKSAIWFETETLNGTSRFTSLLTTIQESSTPYPLVQPELIVALDFPLTNQTSVESYDEKTTEHETLKQKSLRQDGIENGLQATDDIFIQKIVQKMEVFVLNMFGGLSWSTILNNKNLTNEDLILLDEYDKVVYLSSLKLLCESMFPSFEQEMHRIHNEFIQCGELKVAPVKRMSRAVEKIGTDYHDESHFPKSARILDLLRCSLTFRNVSQLVDGVTKFKLFVDTNASGRGCTQIVRMKNGLVDQHKGYKDVKLNVVFQSKELEKAVIAEVQCILQEFLYIKKEQHRLYSIIRKDDVFELVGRNATNDFSDRLIFNGARFDNLKWLCRGIVLGGDVNRRFYHFAGQTPLIIATQTNNVAAMKVLIDNGARIDLVDNVNATALYAASNFGFLECVEVLLDHGADVNVRNTQNGETSKESARRLNHTDVVQAFDSRGL